MKKTMIILSLVALNVNGMNKEKNSINRAIQERLSFTHPIRGPDYDRGIRSVLPEGVKPAPVVAKAPAPVVAKAPAPVVTPAEAEAPVVAPAGNA